MFKCTTMISKCTTKIVQPPSFPINTNKRLSHSKMKCSVIYTHKFTSEFHNQTTLTINLKAETARRKQTFLAPSADNQTHNYDTKCSDYNPSLSTLGAKGLNHSKMKWWAMNKYKFSGYGRCQQTFQTLSTDNQKPVTMAQSPQTTTSPYHH